MIPPLLHFIWIQKKQFGYQEFLCLKSALKNTPYQVTLHTNLKPGEAGIYCPYALQHPRLSVDFQPYSLEYKGIKVRPATLSDILRIQILQEQGGIYSDMDMLWLKPFPISLDTPSLVASWQNQAYKIVTNWMIASEKNYNFTPLLEEFDSIFEVLKKKGVKSIEGDTLKEHLTLFKATSTFLRTHSDVLLKRCHFGKNTWKNIWRFLTDQLPEDKIVVEGITGLHICGCGFFGEYRVNTSDLLIKHSKLKKITEEILR